MKEFADDNFKFDKNGKKLSEWVENTGGKGEIARFEQFLLFPQCFQKACFLGASKGVIVWEWVNLSKIASIHRSRFILLSTNPFILDVSLLFVYQPFPKQALVFYSSAVQVL